MTKNSNINLDKSWLKLLEGEFEQPYMKSLRGFLKQQKSAGSVVYPKETEIFNALNLTPLDRVEVVILGQDPYHGEGQAHGLAFSVQEGVALPPSLLNIYKEIEAEFGAPIPRTGDLTPWAKQGVLLLNATLTVEQARAGSHQGQGWEQFTDAVVRAVNDNLENVVFMLWGAYAQKKGAFIDAKKHLVLKAPHPSPLSAHRGFFGCNHFKKANEYLSSHNRKPINWASVGNWWKLVYGVR